jgi:DNA-binding NtrC family response regulator
VELTKKQKFAVLLCGKKETMEKVRRLIVPSDELHLQFASAPGFLAGRALFHTPNLVLVEASTDTILLRSALKDFLQQSPDTPVLAIAAKPDHSFAVDLVKLGVAAYYVIPDEGRRISDQITLLFNDWVAKRKKGKYVDIQRETYDFRHIIGDSASLRTILERAHKVIENVAMTVLITGETGTGKELIARAIHFNGKNRNSPFIDIACSALPETLLESELFGHEKGAFTDAKERKVGLFELAGDGSIFLDEIGDISLAIQSKLLKVIEDRTMRRVGGVRDIPVRARILAATSADLEAKMRAGEFRKDLYHRLKILPLELPPLRDRKEDIPALVDAFLKNFNNAYNKHIKGITHLAMQMLIDREWEGNVRELKHSIERAVLLEEGDWITEKDFEFAPAKPRTARRRAALAGPEEPPPKDADTMILMVPLNQASLEQVQRLLARKVMERVGGNKVKTARILKVSRPRLDRILSHEEDDAN